MNAGPGAAPLRVLTPLRPGRHAAQPFIPLLCAALGEVGVQVVPFSIRAVLRRKYHVWHVHWPDAPLRSPNPLRALWKTTRMLGLFLVARARGARLLWTVHNLRPHERHHPRIEQLYMRLFVAMVGGTVHPSAAGREAAFEAYPGLRSRPSWIIPLGHYRDQYPNPPSRAQARASLGIARAARVTAFVGLIRAYKNVPELIRAFRARPDPDAVLLVAGSPRDRALMREVREAAADDPRVRLLLEFIPDEDLAAVVCAADLLALPFSDIHNSSTVFLALSMGVPVLVPAMPALKELQQIVGERWVITYEGTFGSEVLGGALARVISEGLPDLEWCSWPVIARRTRDAYASLLPDTKQALPERPS